MELPTAQALGAHGRGTKLGFEVVKGEGLVVLSDSTAAIGIASQDPTKRTRQFELNAHFVRDAVAFRTVDLKYVTTNVSMRIR